MTDTTHLRALLDLVPALEWEHDCEEGPTGVVINSDLFSILQVEGSLEDAKWTATAEFVAACNPVAIRALVDELDGLRATLADYPSLIARAYMMAPPLSAEERHLSQARHEAALRLGIDPPPLKDVSEATAPPEPRKVVIWNHRGGEEEELPACDDIDEAVENALDEYVSHYDGELGILDVSAVPAEIELHGYARMQPRLQAWRYLEKALEDMDEEHSDGKATKPTLAMTEAAEAFARTVESEYVSWACEVVETRVVNVREWCAAHRPDWLAQLPALAPEEGGTQ